MNLANITAYVILLGAIFLAVAMDGLAGGPRTLNSGWPITVACIAAILIWYVSERIDGTIAGAATGYALAGTAYQATAIFLDHALMESSVTLTVGVVSMVFAISTAVTGSFCLFHRGLAFVGLTTLGVPISALILMGVHHGFLSVPMLVWLAMLPVLLCLYALILCIFRVQPQRQALNRP